MATSTLKDFIERMSKKHPEVKSRDNIDFGEHLSLASGVTVDETKLTNHYGYDEPYLGFRLKIPGTALADDREFLKTIYQEGSQHGNETGMIAHLNLDDFKAVRLPIDCAYSLWANKQARVYNGQNKDRPLGSFVSEEIQFKYSNLGGTGSKIEVSGSLKYSEAVKIFRERLGLTGYNVIFESSDYDKMKEWLPEKFTGGELFGGIFVEVPLSAEEVRIAEAVLERPILPDHIPCAQFSMGLQDMKLHSTHIKGFYRNIDAEAEPEEAFDLVTKGFELLQETSLDDRVMKGKLEYDVDIIKDRFKTMLESVKKRPKEQGIEDVNQIIKWFDPDRKYFDSVAKGVDASYLVENQDVDMMVSWYLAYLEDEARPTMDERPLSITYQAKDVPASAFPNVGDIRKLDCQTEKPRDEEDRMGVTTNRFGLTTYNPCTKREGPYQEVSMCVSLSDPILLETQQKVLDKIGVSFR